jgi:predicted RNase H-like nuclease (RuvC/YqgF family)
MKKSILSVALFAFMAGTISTSYGQVRDQKSFSERGNVQESNKDRTDAKQDYKEVQRKSDFEFQKFKKEGQAKIRNNEKRISELKVKISKFNTREKADYQKNLRVLEQKNANLKRKLANYKEKQQDKWTSFKSEIDRDLDEVGNQLRDFSVDNRREDNKKEDKRR